MTAVGIKISLKGQDNNTMTLNRIHLCAVYVMSCLKKELTFDDTSD